ncbi:MAG: peptidoglycan-binding protein [Acidobacteriota bacterium]|nr:peptidoglycan-binding protein [Acidobacteriota bacterium]
MTKPARWIAILASMLIGCVAQAATTTKPAIRRGRALSSRASYRTVRFARHSASNAAHPAHASSKKSHRAAHYRHSRRRSYHHRVRLPKAPTSDRITQIQTALARGGYYKGDATGKWDSSTVAALQKFQSSNNIDATGKLDAPTLQKLGLGSDIAGVAAPRPVVSAACCAAPDEASAPAVPAKSAGTESSAASVAHAQPATAPPTSPPNSASGPGASTTTSAAPAPASSDSGAAGPAPASKPSAPRH